MRRTLVCLTACLFLAVWVSGLNAAEKQSDVRGPEKWFQQLDSNKDGQITEDELAKAPPKIRPMLEKADTDGDKIITLEEFAAAVRERRQHHSPEGDTPGADKPRSLSGPGQAMPSPEEIFRRLDKNNDQQLSLEEFKEGLKLLRELAGRRASDGSVGPATAAGAGGRGREMMMERFKAADTNNDGKLSKEEAPEPLKQHFEKVDANGDGFVTPDELRSAVQKLRKPQGGNSEGK